MRQPQADVTLLTIRSMAKAAVPSGRRERGQLTKGGRFGARQVEPIRGATVVQSPRRPPRYMWGYVRLRARYRGTCEGCHRNIEKGEELWWHPELRTSRCCDCTPSIEVKEADDFTLFVDKAGESQETWEAAFGVDDPYDLPTYTVEERLILSQISPEFLGVRVFSEDDDQPEDVELLQNTSLRSRDARNTRDLTSVVEVQQRPFERVLTDLKPIIAAKVWEIGRTSGQPRANHAHDLSAIGDAAVWQATRTYRGKAPFGAFAAVVIRNRLIDYVRKEVRQPGASEESHDPIDDPTERWCSWFDFQAALTAARNSNLVIQHWLGWTDHELGSIGGRRETTNAVCVRRSRASAAILRLMSEP